MLLLSYWNSTRLMWLETEALRDSLLLWVPYKCFLCMYVCNCVCIVMGPSHRRPHYVLHLVRLSVPFGHLSQTVDSQHFKEYIDQIICNDVYCADAIALARCQWEYILFVFVTCAELVAICTATQVQTVQTTSGTRRTGGWDAGEARATRHCWQEEEDCRRRRAFCAEGGTVQGIYVLICGYQEPPNFFISKMGRNFFTKLSGFVGVRIAHMAFTMEKTVPPFAMRRPKTPDSSTFGDSKDRSSSRSTGMQLSFKHPQKNYFWVRKVEICSQSGQQNWRTKSAYQSAGYCPKRCENVQ